MSTDKTNIHELNGEFYYYDQTIMIAFDIEYIMLIAYTIHAVE